MTEWNPTQLSTLHTERSLQLSAGPHHPGGLQVEVGMVVVGGGCFVRAQRGPASRWYRAALEHGHGQIRVGGQPVEVVFSRADPALSGAIDIAYHDKYGPLASIADDSATREATLSIRPAPNVRLAKSS